MATRRRFEASYDTTLSNLATTFAKMGATSVAVELGARLPQRSEARRQVESPLRRRGWVLTTEHPALLPFGAAVAFARDDQPYRLHCTTFPDWRDNLRAVGLSIARIYSVYDEFLVGEGEQGGGFARLFGGFLALPAVAGDPDPARPWHEVLAVPPDADRPAIEAAYRRLALVAHPDRSGGSAAAMVEINAARGAGLLALGAGREVRP